MPKSNRGFARLAWLTLAWNVIVILWGAWVRASGSGAGCGSHWPLCNGEVIPTDPAVETLIELTHRLSSGVALILVVALWWLARRWPKGERVRTAANWSLVFIIGEAAIGAMLVLLGLVATNTSAARGWVMGFHLCNTFVLLGALTLTACWSTDQGPAPSRRVAPELVKPALLAVIGMMLVGATGAIAALGDTLFPAASLADGLAADLDASSHMLLRLRGLHPLIAVVVSLLLLQLAGRIRRRGNPAATSLANWLTVAVFLQVALGGLNVVLLAPVWMQLVHLAMADVVWIVLVMALAAVFTPPAEATAPQKRSMSSSIT